MIVSNEGIPDPSIACTHLNVLTAIVLDQLLAASNFRVSRQTFEAVDHWLNSITVAPLLFLDELIQENMDDCMTAYMEYISSQSF